MESIRIAGRRIEFRRIEAPRPVGPVLLFLHEGLGSAALWRDFPDRLCEATGCAGIVYSRYGNGFSEPLESARNVRYMHDEAAHALSLLDALNIERAILYGHSDGASIALLAASRAPERVRALILEAPHVIVEALSVKGIAAITERYGEGDMRERIGRHHVDGDRTFFGWSDIWLSPEFARWDITGDLAAIRAPMFGIQGTGDEYGSLAQLDEIADRASAALDRLILERCGHAPHRDRARMVQAACVAWLREMLDQ